MTTRRMALALQGRAPRWRVRDETGASSPRGFLFDDMFSPHYDDAILDGAPAGVLSRSLPQWAKLAAEIRRRHDEYDVVVTWSERVALALMAMERLRGAVKPHVALMYWFSRPSVRLPMLASGPSLHALVTWSSVQRRFAIEHLGVPSEKIYLVKHYVDQLFWRPQVGDGVTICSAGSEMRDYPTLIEALQGTDIPCHIASDHVRVDRFGFARRTTLERLAPSASQNVTIGRKPITELRDLYARSRFVVVPLRPSDTDNGITVILEAMAMGKPVICSRTRGQVDAVEDGVTGVFVPVGDSKALREAIRALWLDPQRAQAMGRAARAYVERHHALETFCHDVKGAIDASLDGRPAAPDGSFS